MHGEYQAGIGSTKHVWRSTKHVSTGHASIGGSSTGRHPGWGQSARVSGAHTTRGFRSGFPAPPPPPTCAHPQRATRAPNTSGSVGAFSCTPPPTPFPSPPPSGSTHERQDHPNGGPNSDTGLGAEDLLHHLGVAVDDHWVALKARNAVDLSAHDQCLPHMTIRQHRSKHIARQKTIAMSPRK